MTLITTDVESALCQYRNSRTKACILLAETCGSLFRIPLHLVFPALFICFFFAFLCIWCFRQLLSASFSHSSAFGVSGNFYLLLFRIPLHLVFPATFIFLAFQMCLLPVPLFPLLSFCSLFPLDF
jgi:hypothetical protein